jgi:hypothetical protein
MQGLLVVEESVDYSDITRETPKGSFACWFDHRLEEEGARGHPVSQESLRLSDYLLLLGLDS